MRGYRPVGWRSESYRHYLAAKGISSKPGFVGRVGKTAMLAEPVQQGHMYPVTPAEVKKILERMPKDDRKGLKAVEFVEPRKGEQEGAWAQYKRGKRTVLIFAQPEEECTDGVKKHMKEYVVPHEVGHHVALHRRGITDKRLSVAESRADAYACGMDVADGDAGMFQKLHE